MKTISLKTFSYKILSAVLMFGVLSPSLNASGLQNNNSWQSYYASLKKATRDVQGFDQMQSFVNKEGIVFNPDFADKDSRYFTEVMASVGELPIIEVKGEVYSVLNPQSRELLFTVQKTDAFKFLINNKEFVYNTKLTLKDNLVVAKKLVEDVQEKSAMRFLESFFMPQAHAISGWGVVVGALLGFLGYKMVSDWQGLKDGVKRMFNGTKEVGKGMVDTLDPRTGHKQERSEYYDNGHNHHEPQPYVSSDSPPVSSTEIIP